MEILQTGFDDLLLIKPKIFEDNRGYFFESYNKRLFEENGLFYDFIQDNQSKSKYGTIRGLHLQLNPFAQAKLVRVLQGTILDVAVDLRKNKQTFGKVFSVELSENNKNQLLIPEGFAHGFSVLSEYAVVSYKVNNMYSRENEFGIIFDDKTLNINWEIKEADKIISEKDSKNELFDADKMYF
jgi:dTDP-4-dehydrorhamnose 3,5-epimerase